MSLRSFDQQDHIFRTSMPSLSAISEMFWVYLSGDANRLTIFSYRNDRGTDSQWINVGTQADGTTLMLQNQTNNYGGSALSVATWYHVAMTKSGNNFVVYLNGVADITQTDAAATNLINAWYLFNANTNDALAFANQLNGRMAGYKLYTAVLTAEEIKQEMLTLRPQRTTNLYSWAPMVDTVMANNFLDLSGNGNNWTAFPQNATLDIEDGPPAAWGLGHHRAVIAPPRTRTHTTDAWIKKTPTPGNFLRVSRRVA